jgi:5-methylcytosine-specific restriction endonuclease McrA
MIYQPIAPSLSAIRMAKWRRNNPEKARDAYRRDRLKQNREEKRKRDKRSYQKHKKNRLENMREWRKNNIEKSNEILKRYRTSERGRVSHRAHQQRRYAAAKASEGVLTSENINLQYSKQKGRCYYCNNKVGNKYHVDHVVPLARGGLNIPENIVIACPSCNQHKSDKLPHEWPEGGRLL